MRVALVHGIRHFRAEPPPEAARHYARLWRPALLSAPGLKIPPETLRVDVAYYAHHLAEPGRQGPADALDADAAAMLETFLKPWLPTTGAVQGHTTRPLRWAISKLAQHHQLSEQQTEWFLERFFSEVAAFLRVDGRFTPKTTIIDTVAEAIDGADVVIAHSLGSIVAYETLWRHHIPVHRLITIGSPLALPQLIFPRLTPAPVNGVGARPPGVGAWFNLADHGDIVAIPRHGVRTSFTGVTDDRHDNIAAFDFHSILNYLRCPELASFLN